MKLTKSKLKQIIKEELDTLMNEEGDRCAALEKRHKEVYEEMRLDPMGHAGMELDGIEKEAEKLGCPWYLKWRNK